MDPRLECLSVWVRQQLMCLGYGDMSCPPIPVSGDASFRRYFRIYATCGGVQKTSFIVMDAPPDKEAIEPFIKIAKALFEYGVTVPDILVADIAHGYILMTDLGDELYLSHLNENTSHSLYQQAMQTLLKLQSCETLIDVVPQYDENLLKNELNLFKDWFCCRLLGIAWTDYEERLTRHVFDKLIQSALSQPQALVHRDYHSRNLMYLDKNNPGVLDFQDAVKGPITYDLVSLLRDCYIRWPIKQVQKWTLEFYDQLRTRKCCDIDVSAETFLLWFDWMGLQRHLKVLGIFARLNLRDGKPRYLNDIPLVFDYVLETAKQYDEFSEFLAWLQSVVYPRWHRYHLDRMPRS